MVAQWVSQNEEVAKAYEQALRIAADEYGQETIEIADGADPETVSVAKLRVDARQKLSGKLYRDRYGEQVQHTVTIDPFTEVLRRVSERRLAEMKALQCVSAQTEKDVTPLVPAEPMPLEDPI